MDPFELGVLVIILKGQWKVAKRKAQAAQTKFGDEIAGKFNEMAPMLPHAL